MSQKCNTLQGSSTTACSLKILCGERANELGGRQGETERRQKFLRTIFAFITLETTKVVGRVLPSTNHLLFYDGPCDLASPHLASTTLKSAFFRAKTVTRKSFLQPPYRVRLTSFLWQVTSPLRVLETRDLPDFNERQQQYQLVTLGRRLQKVDIAAVVHYHLHYEFF